MKKTKLRHITILPMILALAHAGILGVRLSPDATASSSGASVEVVQMGDDVEGRGWLERLACATCFAAVIAASTASLGTATVGGLLICGMLCYNIL